MDAARHLRLRNKHLVLITSRNEVETFISDSKKKVSKHKPKTKLPNKELRNWMFEILEDCASLARDLELNFVEESLVVFRRYVRRAVKESDKKKDIDDVLFKFNEQFNMFNAIFNEERALLGARLGTPA